MLKSRFTCPLLCLVFAHASSLAADSEFKVVGYLPDYRTAQFDPSTARLLTDLIVFSAQPTDAGGIELGRLKRAPWETLRTAKTRHRVRLILCVGGWGRSAAFPALATSAEKRAVFVAAAVRVCLAERLDGLDLDWEHPKNAEEEAGYGKLLAALKAAFKPHGLVLSVTMAGWQKLPAEGYGAVDSVQLMAYDHNGRHATFEAATGDVKKVTDNGATTAKVVLGLPFYGRSVKERGKTMTFREIVAKYHPEAGVDEIDGVYFNGPDTIRKKVEYARKNALGGVMIWELGQDAEGEASLLRVIRRAIGQ